MNIFATYKCPIKSAQALDDKRRVKMILECAQLLSTAVRLNGGNSKVLYKITHKNHPCSVWVRQNRSNYKWVLTHMLTLCELYTEKTGKTHASEKLIPELMKSINYLPEGDFYGFVNCAANKGLGISFKHIEDVCLAYRLYLAQRWKDDFRTPTWSGKKLNSELFYNNVTKLYSEILSNKGLL